MTRFNPGGAIWGNSQITARDQTRFFLHIDAFLPARHREYGLRLLRTVVPSPALGDRQARPPRLARLLQGRLGLRHRPRGPPGRATARATRRLAVAVLTAADGSHAAGKHTLEGVFRRLLSGL